MSHSCASRGRSWRTASSSAWSWVRPPVHRHAVAKRSSEAASGLVAVAGCQLFYFNAIERMPVGVALLLEYLAAVIVVGWLWLRHGQRPRRLTVVGAVAAVAGLAMILDLGGSAQIDPIGVM